MPRHRLEWRLCVVAVGGSFLLTGCLASRSDVDQLRDDINLVRAENAAADSVRAMQLVQILSSLRAVNDSIGALSTRITRVRAEAQGTARDLREEILKVQEMAGQSEQRVQEMRATLEGAAGVARAAPQSTADTGAAAIEGPGPNQLFQFAREQLGRGSNSAARIAFSDLLARYPQSDLAPDAQFYLAEALAAEGNAAAADTAYRAVVSRYPGSPRAATALYKRGSARQQAGRRTEARRIFQDLINRFPASDEAALARERLRALQ